MLVVTRFAVPPEDGSTGDAASRDNVTPDRVTRDNVTRESRVDADPSFLARAGAALELLSGRPGFRSGHLGRATDDPACWVLVTDWENVGSYRRALSDMAVRLTAVPLLALAEDEPSAFEVLLDARPGEPLRRHAPDRAWPVPWSANGNGDS
jgi:hypothetical protein